MFVVSLLTEKTHAADESLLIVMLVSASEPAPTRLSAFMNNTSVSVPPLDSRWRHASQSENDVRAVTGRMTLRWTLVVHLSLRMPSSLYALVWPCVVDADMYIH